MKCTENFSLLLYKTNRFHFAVGLFSYRSQRLLGHLFCSYHILTSSVIYNWTDTRQNGIYLLSRPWKNVDDSFYFYNNTKNSLGKKVWNCSANHLPRRRSNSIPWCNSPCALHAISKLWRIQPQNNAAFSTAHFVFLFQSKARKLYYFVFCHTFIDLQLSYDRGLLKTFFILIILISFPSQSVHWPATRS